MAAKKSTKKYRVLVPYAAAFGPQGAKFGDEIEIDAEHPQLDAYVEAGTLGDDGDFEEAQKEYLLPGATAEDPKYYVNQAGQITKPPKALAPGHQVAKEQSIETDAANQGEQPPSGDGTNLPPVGDVPATPAL